MKDGVNTVEQGKIHEETRYFVATKCTNANLSVMVYFLSKGIGSSKKEDIQNYLGTIGEGYKFIQIVLRSIGQNNHEEYYNLLRYDSVTGLNKQIKNKINHRLEISKG